MLLKGGGNEDGARLFLLVSSDRARDSGHKLGEVALKLKENNLFTLRVLELGQAAQKGCGVPSGDFQRPLRCVPVQHDP